MGYDGDSCHVDEPYPPVRVSGPNNIYAAEILSNIGGCVSEMSAVTLFFYNELLTEKEYSNISSCFRRIGTVEMRHLEIFGRLSMLLGADPRLWCTRCSRKLYWSPAFNRYPREIKALLRNSIEVKSASVAKYSAQANAIKDPYIVDIISRIIRDEQCHLDIFHSVYSQLKRI